ncbi:UBA/TS-N domain family protein [Clavispora lusitaniae]|uniref:UBA domain-containing protein n=1 Tax=Clavispora lusitaniae (strain ATCC 42720) TaxID=306902 RepID=C4Y640_CLAL4|nr:uncharacterized protein CLUG_03624 [Clavispora lusitaniae ATCC 42720]EEQ39496.1 hypothetical protein CLUG_03624 [Clavispora lusitaniae ATCC 42720]KAF7582535.1 UBA/TS-N domain family protein [Clavispora lusitaniae]
MEKDSQVQMLQEMGFSNEQAITALRATGHDLTRAIAYLFGEEESKDLAPPTNAIDTSREDTVNISNPQELPDFLSQNVSGEASEIMPMGDSYHDEYSTRYEEDVQAMESGSLPDKENKVVYSSDDSSLEDMPFNGLGPNIKQEGHLFPIIVSSSSRYKIWVALLMILVKYPPFVEAVLSENNSTGFLRELQRIVYFVQNFHRSKRYYISADELFETLSDESEDYTDEDAVLNIYEQLIQYHEGLATVLRSWVESLEEEVTKDISVLEIYSDARRPTLYHNLNELFWQESFSKLGVVKYKSVAPIVTYQLVGDDQGYATPFEMDEYVYPEIYSDIALEEVKKDVEAMKQAKSDITKSRQRTMNLTLFEGKRIESLLNQTASVLEPHDEASSKDLRSVIKDLSDLRIKEAGIEQKLQQVSSGYELGHFDNVIKSVPDMRRYSLLGVIAEGKYYMRVEDTWVQMEDGIFVDFEDIQADVNNLTRNASNSVTLIYAAEIFFETLSSANASVSVASTQNDACEQNEESLQVNSETRPCIIKDTEKSPIPSQEIGALSQGNSDHENDQLSSSDSLRKHKSLEAEFLEEEQMIADSM